MEQIGSHWMDIHKIWCSRIFRKSVEKIQVPLKLDNNRYNIHFWSYLAHFFLEWEMFQTKVVEKIKTHVLCSVTFFLSLEKFKFHWNMTIITGTLHEDQYTFLIISRSFLLRMRNVSDKSCRENQNTCFVFSNFFSLSRKIQVSLKSDDNNRYCTWRPIYIFDHISLSSP